jgi:hypothetical protein
VPSIGRYVAELIAIGRRTRNPVADRAHGAVLRPAGNRADGRGSAGDQPPSKPHLVRGTSISAFRGLKGHKMDQVHRCRVSALRQYPRKFLTSRSQANRITRHAPELRHGAMGARPQPFPEGSNRLVTSCRPLYPRRIDCSIYRTSLFPRAFKEDRKGKMTPSRFATATSCALLPALFGSWSVADVNSDWNTRLHRTARAKGGHSRSIDHRSCASRNNERRLHRPPSLRTISHRRIFRGLCVLNPKAQRGHSRDQRSDCKQLVVGLVVNCGTIPHGQSLRAERGRCPPCEI